MSRYREHTTAHTHAHAHVFVHSGFLNIFWKLCASAALLTLALLPLSPVFASEEQDGAMIDTAAESEAVTDEGNNSLDTVEEPVMEIELENEVPNALPENEDVTDTSSSDAEGENLPESVSIPAESDGVVVVDTTAETSDESDTTELPIPTGVLPIPEVEPSSTPEVAPPNDVFPDQVETDIIPETDPDPDTNTETDFLPDLPSEATSTELIATSTLDTVSVNTLFNDENKFMFSKDECVSMSDNSFYCSTDASLATVDGTERVFSAIDVEGDREIYVERKGELTQITSNQVDDDAPVYDELSESIVWHRLIDERYQIMSYDVDKEEERQLTQDRYNNMQPSRFGDIIVWQGWVGNDWEIMLEEDGELSMITDNNTHDISPRINGNYIMWQSFEDGAWRVKVYDRLTKQVDTIADSEGASVDNPRFVLIYDTKLQNGDVETKGYDLESGEVVPLSSKPGATPDNIPDPDQTGEDRALVNQLTQPKPRSDTDSNNDSNTGPEPEPQVGTTTPEATMGEDVVILPFTPGTTTPELILDDQPDVSLIQDLIIPDLESSIQVLHPDLIIAPFIPSGEETLDSQEDVASST